MVAGALAAMLADGWMGEAGGPGDRREASLAFLINGIREPKPRLKWSAPG